MLQVRATSQNWVKKDGHYYDRLLVPDSTTNQPRYLWFNADFDAHTVPAAIAAVKDGLLATTTAIRPGAAPETPALGDPPTAIAPASTPIKHPVTPPVLLFKKEPSYSEAARQAKCQGTVVLYVMIGADGIPGNIKVLRSLGLGLDEKAVEAVGQWRFKAGTRDGQPVSVETQVEVNFRLLLAPEQPEQWVVTRLQFPLNVSRRVIAQSFPPDCSKGGAALTLTLNIGADGEPAGVSVLRTTNESLNRAVVKAIQGWRFTPAPQNAASAAARAELDLRCTPAPAR